MESLEILNTKRVKEENSEILVNPQNSEITKLIGTYFNKQKLENKFNNYYS